MSLKNIFSYRTSFGYLSPNNNNNNIELPIKFPLSSRNKNTEIDRNNVNLYLTNQKYFTKRNNQSQSNNNKSTLSKKDNNLYVLINNSRNKIVLNNSRQIVPGTSIKFLNIQNSITPVTTKFKLRQKKKLKQSYSLLNNKFFNKNKFWQMEKNNAHLKENFLMNNFIKDENNGSNVKNKNVNKNSSIFINKSNSIKSKNMYHNNSSRNLNPDQINKRINNKRDITGMYVKDFIRAFNNSKKLRSDFLSHRDKE
jgi:hypothetical protein